MRMNGMKMRDYWLVNFIFSLILSILTNLVFCLFGYFILKNSLFMNTGWDVLFVVLFGWILAQIGMSTFLQVFLASSQAANIIEALEIGATTLLLDEDTSATNFMVRDARMQALVHKENEPITPFVDRVRDLYDKLRVSTVLVMGGSGDYFDMADTIIMMRDYLPHDVTSEAKQIARRHPSQRRDESTTSLMPPLPRIPLPESFDASRGRRDVKINAKGLDLILFGKEPIDLQRVEQLIDWSQTNAIGYAIYLASARFMNGQATLREVIEAIETFFDQEGIDELDPYRRGDEHPGAFARPRPHEIAAAINRLRTVRMRQK